MKQSDFVYSEEVVSPHGDVKVIFGYNDGEKSPTTVEARIIDALSGEVLVDLWGTWCQSTVEFVKAGQLLIKVHDPYYRGLICEAQIDLDRRVFALATSPQQWHPLAAFRQTMLESRQDI